MTNVNITEFKTGVSNLRSKCKETLIASYEAFLALKQENTPSEAKVVKKELNSNHIYASTPFEEVVLWDSIDPVMFLKFFEERLYENNPLVYTYMNNAYVVGKYLFVNQGESFTFSNFANTLKEQGYNDNTINREVDKVKVARIILRGGLTFNRTTDVEYVYDISIPNTSSSLGSSCMRGAGSRYTELQNCLEHADDLQIIYYTDKDDNLVARTLLWADKVTDRIYTVNESVLEYVKADLKKRGFCSTYYSEGTNEELIINCKEFLGTIQTPYLDSTHYYYAPDEGGGYLTNTFMGSGYYCIQSCDGYDWNNRRTCAYCGEVVASDDAYYVDGVDNYGCCDCLDQSFVLAVDTDEYREIDECYHAVDTGRYFRNNCNVYYASDTDEYYEDNDSLYYAEDTGDYHTDAFALYITEEGSYYGSSESLYLTVDTQNFFEDNGHLYYAEDTDEYYEDKGNLYESMGCFYTEDPHSI